MSAGDSPSRGVVLVVEDEPDIRALVAREVTHMGLSPRAVATARDALDEPGPLDLALIDVLLPESSGVEVAHALRQRTDMARLPIIFVTIVDQIADTADLDPPPTIVHKPFKRADLRAAIEAALGGEIEPGPTG